MWIEISRSTSPQQQLQTSTEQQPQHPLKIKTHLQADTVVNITFLKDARDRSEELHALSWNVGALHLVCCLATCELVVSHAPFNWVIRAWSQQLAKPLFVTAQGCSGATGEGLTALRSAAEHSPGLVSFQGQRVKSLVAASSCFKAKLKQRRREGQP